MDELNTNEEKRRLLENLKEKFFENSYVVKDEKRTICYYAHPYSSQGKR